MSVETADPTRALHNLTGWALQRGARLEGLAVERPTLEDVYLQLVGEDGDFAGAARAALALGRAEERERRAFVSANSWRSRHDALLELAFS